MTHPAPRRLRRLRPLRPAALALLLLLGRPARAWSDHALCTWAALSVLAPVATAPAVAAEPLEQFLAHEGPGLEALLADEEAWARAHVPAYPPRPQDLAFHAQGAAPGELLRRFVAATRINPQARLGLYVQVKPGQAPKAGAVLRAADVTPLRHIDTIASNTFIALQPGERVPVIDVVATASGEPDFGMDIGLWSDNGTPQGQRYGFGRQPFGNPALEVSSQAPLHIGYYHEASILYTAAPFLARTYPEYRIHLWRSLAAYALRTGHPYWGWRFGGWALHYIQDLSQPYHARVVPGVGVARLLWINTLDLAGLHQPKADMVTLISNRHFALENFQMHALRAGFLAPAEPNAAIQALRDTGRDAQAPYDDATPRAGVSRQSWEAADAVDAALVAALPAALVSDPGHAFGENGKPIDLHAELGAEPARRAVMMDALVPLLGNLGRYSRAFIAGLADGARDGAPARGGPAAAGAASASAGAR